MIRLLDRILYGVVLNPCVIRFLACCTNFLLLAYFYSRIRHQRNSVKALILVTVLTFFIYEIMVEAQGLSTLWSFAFGYIAKKTWRDHYLFWIPCVSIVVPYYLHDFALLYFGVILWPYDASYIHIATGAHVLFAALGFAVRHMCCNPLSSRVPKRPFQT